MHYSSKLVVMRHAWGIWCRKCEKVFRRPFCSLIAPWSMALARIFPNLSNEELKVKVDPRSLQVSFFFTGVPKDLVTPRVWSRGIGCRASDIGYRGNGTLLEPLTPIFRSVASVWRGTVKTTLTSAWVVLGLEVSSAGGYDSHTPNRPLHGPQARIHNPQVAPPLKRVRV